MLKIRKDGSGFTIVELIITMLVGGVLVGSTHIILMSQVHLSEQARDLVIVNAYAENKIESLRSIGFAGLTNGTTSIASDLPSELKSPRSGTLQISAYSTAIKKADISITYNDQGKSRTYSYTTYVGELGVGQY